MRPTNKFTLPSGGLIEREKKKERGGKKKGS
jgi:hypothetical protein